MVMGNSSATSESWKREPFTDGIPIPYETTFDAGEFALLAAGFVPQEMEDKWFVYYEEPYLFFHRSWTGKAVYRLRLSRTDDGDVEVKEALWAKELAAGKETEADHQGRLLDFLVSNLLLGQARPFPRPPGLKESPPGIYQHHVAGTGYPEASPVRKRRKMGIGCLVLTTILMLAGLVGAVLLLKIAVSMAGLYRNVRSPEIVAAIQAHPEDFVPAVASGRKSGVHAARTFSSAGEAAFRSSLPILLLAAVSALLIADRRLLLGLLAPLLFVAMSSFAVSRLGSRWADHLASRQSMPIPQAGMPLVEDLHRSSMTLALFAAVITAFALLLMLGLVVATFQSAKYLRRPETR